MIRLIRNFGKNAVVLFCSIFFSTFLMAQTGTITGTVLDETGSPLVGASVTLESNKRGAVTDNEGNSGLLHLLAHKLL